jgi:phosphate transport system protein
MWETLKRIWKSDNLLDSAWKQSFEMLGFCQEMFLEAMRVLRETSQTNVSQTIRKKDKLVNKYEREVRKKVMTHLSIQSPGGLPEGMVLISIVIDIERLGDYTKNMVDLASTLERQLKGGKFEADLKKIEQAVQDNFEQTIDCIKSSNPEKALELLAKYKWVSKLCDERLMDLVKEKDKNISAGEAVSLGLYFRWLKRVNSHLRNITTSIVNPFHRIGFKPKKK